jgi:hypothetical protein
MQLKLSAFVKADVATKKTIAIEDSFTFNLHFQGTIRRASFVKFLAVGISRQTQDPLIACRFKRERSSLSVELCNKDIFTFGSVSVPGVRTTDIPRKSARHRVCFARARIQSFIHLVAGLTQPFSPPLEPALGRRHVFRRRGSQIPRPADLIERRAIAEILMECRRPSKSQDPLWDFG